MKLRSIVAAFLISLGSFFLAFGAGQRDAPAHSGPFSEDIDRGMLLDAWQMRQKQGRLYSFPETPTIPQSLMRREARGSLNPTPHRRTMACAGWPFQTNGEIFSLPCFDKRSMYFGACDGIFYCVDKKTGAVRWQKEGLERVDSSPTLLEGTVFVAAIDDTLYAMRSDSGKVEWKAQFPGIGYRNPKLLNKLVYITGEGQLLGLDPTSGEVHQHYAFSGDGRDFSWNSKAIVVAVSQDLDIRDRGKGSVVCFTHDFAKQQWTTALGAACLGTLVCDEDNCYLGARDGFFYAIRMTDGKIAWRIDCRSLFTDPEAEIWADGHVVDAGKQVVFSAGHQEIAAPSILAAVDKQTGKVAWTVQHPTNIEGHFLAADGILVAMAEDRQMLLVNIADGKSVSSSPLPAILGKGFFSGQPRGEFTGVSLDQGELFIVGADAHVWRLPFGSAKGTLEWPIAKMPSTPQPQSGSLKKP